MLRGTPQAGPLHKRDRAVKKDRYFNSLLIVLTIFAVGSVLIIWPLRGYLSLAAEKIRQGHTLLPLVAGIAYVVGFFVTRTVEDSFNAIFNKPPFCDIGEQNDGKPRHAGWVDKMLTPIGYLLFFGRVLLIVGIIVLALKIGLLLIGLARSGSIPAA